MSLKIEEKKTPNHHAHFVCTECQLTAKKETQFCQNCIKRLQEDLSNFPPTRELMRRSIRQMGQEEGIPICSRKLHQLANEFMSSNTYKIGRRFCSRFDVKN